MNTYIFTFTYPYNKIAIIYLSFILNGDAAQAHMVVIKLRKHMNLFTCSRKNDLLDNNCWIAIHFTGAAYVNLSVSDILTAFTNKILKTVV